MQVSLGPLLYYWPRQEVLTFYQEASDWPVDVVYLGETVCAKRREMRLDDWIGLARTLVAAGKEVILSSLTLVTAASERAALRRLCENGELRVEANDLTSVELLQRQGIPFVGGAALNIYNHHSLRHFQSLGLYRWQLPVELSAESLAAILAEARKSDPTPIPQTEIFAFGRLPLAYSARCFTARYHNRPKDQCQLICLEHPEGLQMKSQEGEVLFQLNGIQTQSAAHCNLLQAVPQMQQLGVDMVRISPQVEGTQDVIIAFATKIQGKPAQLQSSTAWCNGYWYGLPGLNRVD